MAAFVTATSLSFPGGSGGVRAVIAVGLMTVTPVARTSPIRTLAVAENPIPVMATAVPPAEGPEAGAMLVTGAGAPVIEKTTPSPPAPPQMVVP